MELDTSIIESPKDTTTTMADMYGYSVFSKEFQHQIQVKRQQEKQLQEQCLVSVLTNRPADENARIFEQVLTAETAVVVKDDLAGTANKPASGIEMMGFTILGALLAGGVWMMIDKVRKGKKSS